ncbi:MAG: HEAT repeat domain-containing protein [Haloferacaceae archaeon]
MSLFQHHREGDVEELTRLLEGSDSPAVRRRAAEMLSDFDPEATVGPEPEDGTAETVVETLVAAATADDDVEVRAAAVDALDDLGAAALERFVAELEGVSAGDRADWAVAREYVNALSSDRPEVRMAAAAVLGRIGDGSAVGPLTDLLDDPEPRVRARVVRALGRIGDRRANDPVAARLEDPNAAVRREAAVALGKLGGEVVDPLVVALDDGNEGVRRAAVDSLGDLGREAAVDPLVGALDDGSGTVRRAAVFAVVELLSDAPAERSHEMRDSVVSELRTVDDDAVVEPLVELLREGQQLRQRRNAAWLLGRVASTDDRAADALVDALDDDDDAVTRFASTSLAEMDVDVEGKLLDVLDRSAAAEARAMAAFTLGRVGGERARERLDALVDETDDERVRERALGALSKLGGR